VIVGNVVNFTATVSAAWTYLRHRLFGKPIVWLKTAHTFPAEADLAEYTKSIEDLLVEEGLVTREQIFDAVRLARGASVPFALLRMGLLSEEDFTSVWAKHSGLDVRFIDPYRIPDDLFRGFPERQSMELRAVPVGQQDGRITVAFHEPPTALQLEALQPRFGRPVLPVLARGSNLAFARNRVYPRLVLGGSAVANLPEKFHRSGSLEAVVFLDALSSQQAGRHSLADVVVDMALLSEGEARRAWAEVLGCPSSTHAQLTIDQEPYYRAGPFFWWLHRMLPVQNRKLAIASRCHPGMVSWLTERMGEPPAFVAELPRRLELAARNSGMDLDPEQLLINSLADKGLLKSEDLAQIKTARGLITDPISNWLLLRKAVTQEQLNETFLEVCYLPRAVGWEAAEVRRLATVLPPGFVEETGCYCLEESDGNVRLGLVRIPAAESVRQVYDRLTGCSLFFQSLSHEQARELQPLAAGR
jgi:hypothetical protein